MDEEDNPVDIDSWLNDLKDRFENLEIMTIRKLAQLSEIANVSKSNQHISKPSESQSAMKIERPKFSPFDGDLRKFPQFKSEFDNFVKPHCTRPQSLHLFLGTILSQMLGLR